MGFSGLSTLFIDKLYAVLTKKGLTIAKPLSSLMKKQLNTRDMLLIFYKFLCKTILLI
jgi:hypothetical protein